MAGAAEGARSLLCARAVREAAQRLMALAMGGALEDWRLDADRLNPTADFVAGIVRERYPARQVPVHSRWRHMEFGGRNLWEEVAAAAPWKQPGDSARAAFDLVIISVLLDAGAGPDWQYRDAVTGAVAGRSEGLALASLRWFASGALSDDPTEPRRVDAAALRRIDAAALRRAFQVSDANAMVGLEGRVGLLNRLGATIASRPDLFAVADSGRPGGLFDALRSRAPEGRLPAAGILEIVLDALGPVWQNRPTLAGISLGDCWAHPALHGTRPESGYVPLHKLSQWLSYSLVEPLEGQDIAVTGAHELTGLAEYRNGGLFVDMGVLVPREPAAAVHSHQVGDPFVVGWRGLTVALLDALAPLVGMRLGLAPDCFPLGCLLEGGSWAAGRSIANQLRGGAPPFLIASDGTVF